MGETFRLDTAGRSVWGRQRIAVTKLVCGREYPKLYESHAGRTAGSPLYGASGAVLLFLLAQSLETVKIKIHRRDVLWAK